MPTVLRWNGMSVMIYTNEHTDRAHVHVWCAGRVVIINLRTPTKPQTIREVRGMRRTDFIRAFALVDANTDRLLQEWRRIHGDQGID